MDVGFYSGGGPNHSKTLSLLTFPVTFFIFIAASHARGADLVVGSDFTPTNLILKLKCKLKKGFFRYLTKLLGNFLEFRLKMSKLRI